MTQQNKMFTYDLHKTKLMHKQKNIYNDYGKTHFMLTPTHVNNSKHSCTYVRVITE